MFHRVAVSSALPVARMSPSWLKLTEVTLSVSLLIQPRETGLAGSVTCQRCVSLSLAPAARVFPSALKATDRTVLACPSRKGSGPSWLPTCRASDGSLTFHSRTLEPVAPARGDRKSVG